VFWGNISRDRQYIRKLNVQVTAQGPTAEKIDAMKKRLTIMREHFSPEKSVLLIIKEMYRLVPKNVYVSQLEYEDGNTLSLRGSAKNRVDVYSMVKTMDESGFFESIELRGGISTRKIRQEELYDFNIHGKIKTQLPGK